MTYVAQFSIPYYTLTPEDVVTNTFHFDWTGGSAPINTDYTQLENLVASLYEDSYPAAGTIGLAPWMRPAFSTIKVFNLADPAPRVPVWINTVPLTVHQHTSGTIPTEVSIVLSYQGAPVSGVPQARRRGRIYLGGLGAVSTSAADTAFPRPLPALITNIKTAANNLRLNAPSTSSWVWVVWSRTASTSTPVANGWVDDTFDTQRRRGVATTVRNVWP